MRLASLERRGALSAKEKASLLRAEQHFEQQIQDSRLVLKRVRRLLKKPLRESNIVQGRMHA